MSVAAFDDADHTSDSSISHSVVQELSFIEGKCFFSPGSHYRRDRCQLFGQRRYRLFLSLKKDMVISLLPKSVTTAISVDLSHSMGGVNAVTLAIVVSNRYFWFIDCHTYFSNIQYQRVLSLVELLLGVRPMQSGQLKQLNWAK